MNTADMVTKIINKCDLYIEDNLFSKELLMQSFGSFLAATSDKGAHNTGFVLHTGSVCFEALAFIYAAVSCMIYSESDTDDIISELRTDDTVIYTRDKKPVKAMFKGFFVGIGKYTDNPDEATLIKLVSERKNRGRIEQDIQYVPKKFWNRISPYQGVSTGLSQHGLRRTNGLRDVFYMSVLGYSRDEIPSVIGTSTVIVIRKDRADYLFDNLKIGIDDRTMIKLRDLVTASYFTESDEHPYGGNPGKTEPILKFTSKMSVARELAFSRDGNKHLGVIVCGNEIIRRYMTEIPGIFNRRSLKYVYLLSEMDSTSVPELIMGSEDPKVFACSKEFLKSQSGNTIVRNRLTSELAEQTSGILNRTVTLRVFPSDLSWEEYKELKRTLITIKRSDYTSDKKDEFVLTAYSLINLFSTAIFKLSALEKCVEEGKIGITSPSQRLALLESLTASFPEYLKEKAGCVAETLANQYLALYDSSETEQYIKKEIRSNFTKKFAIVVPKAYYGIVMAESGFSAPPVNATRVSVMTANSFNSTGRYHKIFVTGNTIGNRFDVFSCISSDTLESLIFSYDKKKYDYRAVGAAKNIKILNSLNLGKDPRKEPAKDTPNEIPIEKETEEIYEIDKEVDEYINRLNDAVYTGMFIGNTHGAGNTSTRVIAMGSFESGERIFFTKYYKAYTFNEITGEVKELKVSELEEGLSIVFTQNNAETRDIVDEVLNMLLEKEWLSKEIIDCYRLSKRWKEVLREYKEENRLRSSDIADRMIANGVNVQPATIRIWLDEDAHTVGPREKASLEQIAYLVGDSDMLDNAETHVEAIKVVRKVRRDILGYIGEAIIDKLSGKQPEKNTVMSYIYNRIDSLAVVLRLESIVTVDREIPFNSTNRPLSA